MVTALYSPTPKVIHVRRLIALLGLLSVLFGLASCGGSSDDKATSAGLSAVTVTGDFGKAPEVKWKNAVTTDKLDTDVLVKGDGDALAKGDQASLNIWIGNGFTKKQAFSTYDDGKPQTVPVDDAQLFKGLYAAVEGQTVGSRVLVVAPPKEAFGDAGNPQLGIGNSDDVVLVVDIMKRIEIPKNLDGPSGAAQKPPADAPKLLEKAGVPTGFDFSAAPKKPSAKLQVIPLIKGDGAVVTTGQTIAVDYLGQVYGTKKIFDESYSKEPYPTPIGTGSVVKGWDQGLVGQTVGSRVLLVIPPALGYGDAGKDPIPGKATLVFVVDILAAY